MSMRSDANVSRHIDARLGVISCFLAYSISIVIGNLYLLPMITVGLLLVIVYLYTVEVESPRYSHDSLPGSEVV